MYDHINQHIEMMIKKVSLMLTIATLFSCGEKSSSTKVINTGIPAEHIEATPAQKERREKSETYCKQHNIPIYGNPNAMFSDTDADVMLRTKDEVVNRALALCFIGLKSEGLSVEDLRGIDAKYHIASKLTPVEKEYVYADHPTEQQKSNANWRYEGLHTLLWALGYVEQLSYPDQMCNVANDVKIIHDLSEQGFRDKAILRSKKDILDQADLILRLDWACVDARTNNKPAPGKLNAEVVYERHYALNWLTHYSNQDWDDVSTDT